MSRNRTTLISWMLILCALALGTGCRSSKLNGGRLDPKVAGGVPFNLTRPSFKITEERATPERAYPLYTLGVEYFPDPDQRFIVALDPALLTEADFKLLFSELGQLTELNSETRDQVVPTITAVGSFVVNAIGAVAAAAALDQGAKQPKFFKLLDDYFAANCAMQGEKAECAALSEVDCKALKKAFETIKARSGPPHPFDEREIKVLGVGETIIGCRKAAVKTAFKAAVDELKAVVLPQDATAAQIEQLAEARKLPEQIRQAETEEALEPLRAKIEDLVSPIPTAALHALDVAAQNYLGLDDASVELEGALDKDQWQLRHALYLEEEIAKLERAAIVNHEIVESADLLEHRELWARTIGALEEYHRAQVLRKTLRAVASTEQQRVRPIRESPPMADYDLAQGELAKLETAIAAKRSALAPKAKSDTPTPPPSRDVYPAVYWKSADGVIDKDWVKACVEATTKPAGCVDAIWNTKPKTGTTPEFVVVIEKGVHP